MVVAVGARDVLVGRTSACDHPEDVVADIPIVGGFGKPSLEVVLGRAPTVVIDTDLENESMAAHFRTLGIRHVRIPCKRVNDVPLGIRTVGELAERAEAAGKLADHIARELAHAAEMSASVTNRPAVYVEIWHDPFMTAGKHAYLTDLIRLAGGRNIAEEVNQEYFRVSSEWVLTQNPDVIICAYMASGRDVSQMVRERPGWEYTRAVQSGALFCNENNDIMLRPGPRVLEGLEALKRCIARSRTK